MSAAACPVGTLFPADLLGYMAEYDLDGWTVPGLITPNDVNLFLEKPR
jgi:hypothetical protein